MPTMPHYEWTIQTVPARHSLRTVSHLYPLILHLDLFNSTTSSFSSCWLGCLFWNLFGAGRRFIWKSWVHLLFRGTRNGLDCYGTHRGCNEQLGNNHFWEFGQFQSNSLSVPSFFSFSTAWRCNKTDGPCFSHNLPHLLICLTFEQFHSESQLCVRTCLSLLFNTITSACRLYSG